MKDEKGFVIKEGRKNKKHYLYTEYDLIDNILEGLDSEHLGFYIALKRYIDRKNNTKDDQITYTQKYLQNKLNISSRKYYRYLHNLYNVGLIDIEKTATITFFVNFNIEGKENPKVSQTITFFSTLEGINLSLKGIENHIENYPTELINVIDVKINTSYLIHELPPMNVFEENKFKLKPYRNWQEDMAKFKRGKSKKNKIDPSFQNEKVASSHSEKVPSFQSEKVNNINKLNNNINELSNNTINQSSNNSNRLIDDVDKDIEKSNFKSYHQLIEYCYLNDENNYPYPKNSWIDTVKTAIRHMYSDEYTKVNGRTINRYDVIEKLQKLNWSIVDSAIEKAIAESYNKKIHYPVPFMKSILFNEIDQFEVNIQNDINYSLNGAGAIIDENHENIHENIAEDIKNRKQEQELVKKDSNISIDSDTFLTEENIKPIIERVEEEYIEPLNEVKKEITQVSYNAFIDSILDIYKDSKILNIVTRNDFLKGILENRYKNLLYEKFKEIGIKEINIISKTE